MVAQMGSVLSTIWNVITIFVVFLIIVPVLRRWAKSRSEISGAALAFDVRTVDCHFEEDRKLVQASICDFMYSRDFASVGATEEESLVAFNRLVAKQLPLALHANFGRVGVPYPFMLVLFIPYFAWSIDLLAVQVAMKIDFRTIIVLSFNNFACSAFIMPNCTALCSLIAGTKLHLQGIRGQTWALFVAILGGIAGVAVNGIQRALIYRSRDSLPGLVANIVFCFLNLLVTVCVFWTNNGHMQQQSRFNVEASQAASSQCAVTVATKIGQDAEQARPTAHRDRMSLGTDVTDI